MVPGTFFVKDSSHEPTAIQNTAFVLSCSRYRQGGIWYAERYAECLDYNL